MKEKLIKSFVQQSERRAKWNQSVPSLMRLICMPVLANADVDANANANANVNVSFIGKWLTGRHLSVMLDPGKQMLSCYHNGFA